MVRIQKLIENVFLTLHRHIIHCQQRELSKCLMRYLQFAYHAYCGAAGTVSKMALCGHAVSLATREYTTVGKTFSVQCVPGLLSLLSRLTVAVVRSE
jgi:hypothetical protein